MEYDEPNHEQAEARAHERTSFEPIAVEQRPQSSKAVIFIALVLALIFAAQVIGMASDSEVQRDRYCLEQSERYLTRANDPTDDSAIRGIFNAELAQIYLMRYQDGLECE